MKKERKSSRPPRNWPEQFFKVFCQTGNVMRAAQAAGVDRTTVYARKDKDAKFKAQFEDAEKDALEHLELEAFRRATHGTKKPMFYKGERCGYVREYSDVLLIVLLKARAPEKYRENSRVEHAGIVQQNISVIEVHKETEGDAEEPDRAQWEPVEI